MTMTAVEDRPLRADAARNVERILRAARDVYGELGADAPVEAVARRAGVGERTLYRRFRPRPTWCGPPWIKASPKISRR